MITTTRSQLFREVWQEPVRTVAQRYHVSDVALAKVCRRHKIPLPPRGFWAQARVGREPKRPHLPPLGHASDEIIIRGSQSPPTVVSAETAQLVESILKEPKITVSEELTDPHNHVAAAAKSFRGNSSEHQGVVMPRARPRLDIRVSSGGLERALRIMDALIKGLEARGYAVEVDADGKHSTSAIVQEERVFFYLDEKITRVDHAPTADERLESKRRGWNTWPQYDFVASGALRLRIVDSDYLRVRTKWGDGTKQRVEDCLNEFVAGLVEAAEAIKRRRAERLEQEERWKEEEKRRAKLAELRWLEETRGREVERQAGEWDKASKIRAYVEHARQVGCVFLPETVKIGSLQEWIECAARHADAIDPFVSKEHRQGSSNC